jgi:hypothetical protein
VPTSRIPAWSRRAITVHAGQGRSHGGSPTGGAAGESDGPGSRSCRVRRRTWTPSVRGRLTASGLSHAPCCRNYCYVKMLTPPGPTSRPTMMSTMPQRS